MKIVYLGPDYFNLLEFKSYEEMNELVLNHPNREEYSPESFAEAFNTDWISDQGVISIKN